MRFRRALLRHPLNLATGVLLLLSVYFVVDVELRRRATLRRVSDQFQTGDVVTVVKAIDGDEVQVRHADGQTTVVRILGIKSFSSTLSDVSISQYGQICYDYLKRRSAGKEARIEVGDTPIDAEGRLLAYLYLRDDAGEHTVDLGLELVAKGYTLVYTRYPFTRMSEYLRVQEQARLAAEGLWSSEKLDAKAKLLDALWKEEKAE